MSNLGMSVMLGMLSGNEDSVNAFEGAVGKEIAALDLNEGRLLFTFTDGSKIKLFDDGQCCCECRYLTSDDDIQAFVGASLMEAEVREAPKIEDGWGVHEVAFLVVTTSKGAFTVETHNEHNGYYGGFLLRAATVKSEPLVFVKGQNWIEPEGDF